MDDKQLDIIHAMSPAQKLKTSEQLYWMARKLKAAWLRHQHPDWTEEQVQDEVRKIFLYGRT